MFNASLTYLVITSSIQLPYIHTTRQYQQPTSLTFSNLYISNFFSFLYSKSLFKTNLLLTKSVFSNSLSNAIKIKGETKRFNSFHNSSFNKQQQYSKIPVIIKYCKFIRCTTIGPFFLDGGAIYAKSTDIKITKTIFSECYTTNTGGAIRMDRNGKVIINDCLFFKNKSEFSSGSCSFNMVFILKIENTNFTFSKSNNKIAVASIYISDLITMKNVLSMNNYAPSSYSWLTNGGEFSISDSQFYKENVSYVFQGELFASATFQGCEFYGSKAVSIRWRCEFSVKCVDSIFDMSSHKAIEHFFPILLTISGCVYDFVFNNEEINKLQPNFIEVTPISLSPTNDNIISFNQKKEIKENEAQNIIIDPFVYRDFQYLPGNDPPDKEDTMSDLDFFIVVIVTILLTSGIPYWRRTRKKKNVIPAVLNSAKPWTDDRIHSHKEFELPLKPIRY
ncbi:hypothetical protein TRFO_08521 [Tritrichomonas foetus]|uniref:Right handed beta helix domain-containing protein n=1 Tax=Tritrichomonas foetus TaxID=1144522 RepID=A0A1J4JKU7_9EUKA|nr:hypothetical protein TRFO_08521 [Tritrichomonas foetus]|eukprot:OHS99265.1 hypothetical protein TRFO_08521 [Tritrichomonas foetus]